MGSTREARPDTLVGVQARSVHSGARGGRSQFLSGGSGYKTISLVSLREALSYLVRTHRYNIVVACFLPRL